MNNWQEFLDKETKEKYFIQLSDFIQEERKKYTIYPTEENVFRAFKLCPLDKVKVVIFGQDPYHEPNQANGLAFSVNKGNKIPKSLQNIFIELHNDLNIDIPSHGDISKWAEEGVLLINTIMTVRIHEALSHKNKGWEIFTKQIVELLNGLDRPVVFILLGNNSISYKEMITNTKHFIITAPHPSPLSSYRGFFGSKIFSRCNEFLEKNYGKGINWNSINE